MSMRQVLFSHWLFDRLRIFVNFLAWVRDRDKLEYNMSCNCNSIAVRSSNLSFFQKRVILLNALSKLNSTVCVQSGMVIDQPFG